MDVVASERGRDIGNRKWLTPMFFLMIASFFAACSEEHEVPVERATDAGISFEDVSTERGFDAFLHVSGEQDKMYLPASTGAGVALLDYDRDGALDVFLINGSRIGGFPPGEEPTNALFRNGGHGQPFRDVTKGSGLESFGAWGQGVAVADLDGNGYLDLYVTNYGPNELYLNQGDGTFRAVGKDVGLDLEAWSTGATFIDFDRDGDLDLYVSNFVRYDRVLAAHEGKEWLTHTWKGLTVMSGPKGLPAAADVFYRNESDVTGLRFRDVSADVGVASVNPAYGFQPTLGDYDQDGFVDLFVANDSRPNFLFRNQEGTRFVETAVASGVAYDRAGVEQACMGVAFDDQNGDGALDLLVTNFADELNTLYVGDGAGFFHDATAEAGLMGTETMKSLAWGTFFFDADNDGSFELFVANGHVYPQVDQVVDDVASETYAQVNQLFSRGPSGRFRDIAENSGSGLAVREVSRGAAFGDFDNDGLLEIVINNLDASPTILDNRSSPASNRWVKIALRGAGSNVSAIGARVRLEADGRLLSRYRRSSDSYLSHHDPRLHFGLGEVDGLDRLEIDWPDGSTESISVDGLELESLLTIEQGKGIVERSGATSYSRSVASAASRNP